MATVEIWQTTCKQCDEHLTFYVYKSKAQQVKEAFWTGELGNMDERQAALLAAIAEKADEQEEADGEIVLAQQMADDAGATFVNFQRNQEIVCPNCGTPLVKTVKINLEDASDAVQ